MIAILDFGSQYSELIARRVRESSVYSEVLPHHTTYEDLKKKNVKGIILSGGPASVFDVKSHDCDRAILNGDVPVLGICYGLQLMTQKLGGTVEAGAKREYGKAELVVDHAGALLTGITPSTIWMSHGDHVTRMPEGFTKLAHTTNCAYAAIGCEEQGLYGVQFHPEVVHTEQGRQIIQNFLFQVCQCKQDWTPHNFVEKTIRELREKIGKDNVLCALSGGVDSTVAAALLHEAIGDQLICMFIDQGFMRANEGSRLKKMFTDKFHVKALFIDAQERFFNKISGITDPEEKRKRIGNEFVRVFEDETEKLGGKYNFLAQGTLYPDVIESAVTGSGVAETAVKIKTHHNVGGLPEDMKFKIVEPLRMLFKDEVRQVGLELGLDPEMVFRQPFPGPGLAIRILGEVTPDRVKTLQDADVIVQEEIKAAGLYREVWQAFAVLLPIKTVGVQGDFRTYAATVAIRAVTSEDAMTANWARLPYDVLEKISSRIMNEVDGVNRVVLDISSKPPSTIEWE